MRLVVFFAGIVSGPAMFESISDLGNNTLLKEESHN